jgi:hypothetical protein
MRAEHAKWIAVVAADNGFHFVRSHRRYYCRVCQRSRDGRSFTFISKGASERRR